MPITPALPSGTDEQTVFRLLFSAYPDALLLTDHAGNIVLANQMAAVLLGYSIEELIDLNVDCLVPDAIRPRHAAYRNAYSHAPIPRPMGTHMELTAKRKDGSEVMVEIALSPLQDHGLPFVVAAIRGIGAYPRVKEAIQRARYSEHLAQFGRLAVDVRDMQALLDQVPAIAAAALQVETAMVVLLEANRDEFRVASGVGLVLGEEVGAYISSNPSTSPGFLLLQGEPVIIMDYHTERRFTVPSAYLEAGLVSAMAVPLFDSGRIIGTLAVRSHEPKRFGDEELRFMGSLASLLSTSLQRAQTEEALIHVQRMESVGQLTGGIAHDFNNLLTVILGNLQVLEDLSIIAGDSQASQRVNAATRASRRAAELTGKLLAFSRRQMLLPSAVDVKALLQSMADMLQRTLDQNIHIELAMPPTGLQVQVDPGQLESALLNIAINARDAMPAGGTLCFSAEIHDTLPPWVRHQLDDPSTHGEPFVAIRVTDTGTGMPNAVKERAFEPFFTTKAAGRGTGLGLSTVYGFVKQSKGAVAIDSQPGAGTTVTLYLPCPLEMSPVADPGNRDDRHALPRGLCVLLVEDDPEVCKIAQTFLETLDCVVTTAANGEMALRALGSDTRFNLLLTDIALGPSMRGTELAAQAQHRFPELAILLMSGFSAELLDADRDTPSSWGLLRKPFTRSELAQAIANLLSERNTGV
ncbi:PAS domain S-box protein [Polaromonas sp. OV174]|uniref:PAS domain S-box protein n=1 Tax=Polaromonas sp. OV174 TaxID=1855300 RepID=UPI000B857DA7|nr:PAS domain S-box protein [Polaromonas sp. OV174]